MHVDISRTPFFEVLLTVLLTVLLQNSLLCSLAEIHV